MQYDHFVTSDRVNRYPAYMDKEMRLSLREKMKAEKLSMYCSCSFYSPLKLEYGISIDGKIYPLHQGYVHHMQCVRRNSDKRQSAYVVQEDGSAKVYMGFDISKFTVPTLKDGSAEEEDEQIPAVEEGSSESDPAPSEEESKEKEDKKEKPGKEPTNTLARFILELNNDTYHERLTAGKGLISADYFLSAVYGRLKKIYIDGFTKPLRDLTVNEDMIQFFYQPLSSLGEDGNRIVLKGYKKDFSYFLFESTLEKEKRLFQAKYGLSVEDALKEDKKYTVMAAGFLYLRMSRTQKLYRVVGRLHLFLVNENGLYCRDLTEATELNMVSLYLKTNQRYKTIQFDRIVNDPKVWGIFSKVGKKQVIVCKPSVPARIAKTGPDHVAIGTEQLSKEDFLAIELLFS